MEVVAIVASTVLGVVGLYLTHSLRRQQSLRIAEQRMTSYRGLWELTYVARRSRWDDADGSGALTQEEAHKLYRDMACWYYENGNGMLLTDATLGLYTEIRKRLGEYAVGKGQMGPRRCMDDLSLLRQQMRLDLKAISGRPYYWSELKQGDMDLLKEARIRRPQRWALPWYRSFRGAAVTGEAPAAPRQSDR